MTDLTNIYRSCGISEEVYRFGENILNTLSERFDGFDKVCEYNQLKVINAMHEAKVSEACFMPSSGY